MKKLIIAEKPSVAADLAAALGKFKKNKDFFENDEYIITSALGHLAELYMPEDIDEKLKRWNPADLPIIPQNFKLKPIERTKQKFQDVKKLINREDVNALINACDAGREGELIFSHIYELTKCKKPVERLWMLSMTPSGIRDAFSHLRTQEEMRSLEDAAKCRSESDWLVGINGTRIITSKMYGRRVGSVASVGRVQTPTLALVVDRERVIRNFKPRTFWNIKGKFKIHSGEYEGIYQKPNFSKKSDDEHDRIDRLWEKATADQILLEINNKPIAIVSEKKKRTTQISPRLYDLTSLQREANNRFGFSAGSTLKIAQALYERHKVLTYPRTDAKALPEDYANVCHDVLKILPNEYAPFAHTILEKNWINPFNKRVFNNKDVSDHFAIIPTNFKSDKLSEPEYKIYDMVVRRFLAVFYPAAEYDVTTRISQVAVHDFKTEGKILVNAGWQAIYGKDESAKDALPPLTPQDGTPPQANVLSSEIEEAETTPPPRYTEATLLGAMESAGKFVEDEELAEAMKEKGLGTPATRAQIIEHLISLKYIDRNQRELIPTGKAEGVIEFLNNIHIETLTSPSMTGEWEYRLRQIEEKKMSRNDFMDGIIQLTSKIVNTVKDYTESTESTRVTDILSPTDNQPMLETLRTYKSQDNALVIYKIIGNRKMEEHEIEELVKNKQIGPLDGFRSKLGRPFSATLQLGDDKKVHFVFNNNSGNGSSNHDERTTFEDLKNGTKLGKCSVCGNGIVYETETAYICENHMPEKGSACKLRVSKNLLSRAIPTEQFSKMLAEGKSDLMDNFVSKRTGKHFSAYLLLLKNGDIRFEFEDRKKEKTQAKSQPKEESEAPQKTRAKRKKKEEVDA